MLKKAAFKRWAKQGTIKRGSVRPAFAETEKRPEVTRRWRVRSGDGLTVDATLGRERLCQPKEAPSLQYIR